MRLMIGISKGLWDRAQDVRSDDWIDAIDFRCQLYKVGVKPSSAEIVDYICEVPAAAWAPLVGANVLVKDAESICIEALKDCVEGSYGTEE